MYLRPPGSENLLFLQRTTQFAEIRVRSFSEFCGSILDLGNGWANPETRLQRRIRTGSGPTDSPVFLPQISPSIGSDDDQQYTKWKATIYTSRYIRELHSASLFNSRQWKICLRFFGNPDWVLPVMGFPIGDSTWYFAFLRRNQTSMSPTHVCILKCIWWPFFWCIVRPSSSPIKRDIWGRKNFESVRPDPVHYGSSDWSGSPG